MYGSSAGGGCVKCCSLIEHHALMCDPEMRSVGTDTSTSRK